MLSSAQSDSNNLREWSVEFDGGDRNCLVEVKNSEEKKTVGEYYLLDEETDGKCNSQEFNFRFGVRKEIKNVWATNGQLRGITGPFGIELITKDSGAGWKLHDGNLRMNGGVRFEEGHFKRNERVRETIDDKDPFIVMLARPDGKFWIVGVSFGGAKGALKGIGLDKVKTRKNWNQEVRDNYLKNQRNIGLRSENSTYGCIELFDIISTRFGPKCKEEIKKLDSKNRTGNSSEVFGERDLDVVIMPSDQMRFKDGKLRIGKHFLFRAI